jgi:hypothetical protein
MSIRQRCLILASCLSLMACSKGGAPELSVIDSRSIPWPTFSGSNQYNIATHSDKTTFHISGQCDPKITSIVGKAVGPGSAWDMAAIAVSNADIRCAVDGTFSFDLKSLSDLGFTAVANGTYDVQICGVTSAGLSQPSTIRITTLPGRNPVSVNAGSTGKQMVTDGIVGGLSAQLKVGNQTNDSAGPLSNDGSLTKTDGSPTGLSATIGVRAE